MRRRRRESRYGTVPICASQIGLRADRLGEEMKRRIAGLAVWATFAAVVVVGCRKGSTPVEPLPPPTPSPSPAPTLSGAWIGLVAEDMGSTKIAPYDGGNLAAGNRTIRYDIEATLTQTAGTV